MDQLRTDNPVAKRRKRQALTALVAIAIASGVYAVSRVATSAPHVDRDSLVVDVVQRGELLRDTRAPGVLVPRDIRWLTAQSSARVERLVQRPGAFVEPDTVIVELVNPELETQVREASLALAQGEAQLAALRMTLQSQVLDQKARIAEVRSTQRSAALQAEAEAEAARANAVSQLQAKRSQLLAEQLLDRVNVEDERLATLRASTAAQVRAEAARVAQLRATADRQQNLLDALQVRAGMRGVVQTMPIQVGQQLAAGAQIARVAAPDDLLAELRVPELDARELRVGLTARVDLRNSAIATGRVARVDPGVENGSVRVEIEFPEKLPAGARPDLSVEGTIEIERHRDVLYVGRLTNGQPDSRLTVFKLSSDGQRATRVTATTGKGSARYVIVREGLAAGDRIITSDTSTWGSHDELRIN